MTTTEEFKINEKLEDLARNPCCKVWATGVMEGVFLWDGETWDIDGYEIANDYPINFCPNCGAKKSK